MVLAAGLSDDILHRVLLLEPNLHLQELGKVRSVHFQYLMTV